MSYHKIKDIPIIPSVVRDYHMPYTQATNLKIDLWQQELVVGLDLQLHNRGAASITISLDKKTAKTVEAGDVYNVDNVKFSLVEVTAAVNFDLDVAGLHITKAMLKRHGIQI